MEATLGGVRLHYVDAGAQDAPCLLLVHGFPLDARMWRVQMSGLGAAARIVAPDLRGHGRSATPPGPYTMEQHADDLAALLDHLKIERAIVAGLSMGGYVTLAMWRRHPSRIAALALLDTRAEADAPAARENRDRTIIRVRETGVRALGEEMLPKLMAPANLAAGPLKQEMLDIIVSQPVAGVIGALQGLRDRHDSRPTLPTIDVPTLVVVGEEDALTPPADARLMAAAIRGAELLVIPGAGHLSPLENSQAVNQALRRLIGQATQATDRRQSE